MKYYRILYKDVVFNQFTQNWAEIINEAHVPWDEGLYQDSHSYQQNLYYLVLSIDEDQFVRLPDGSYINKMSILKILPSNHSEKNKDSKEIKEIKERKEHKDNNDLHSLDIVKKAQEKSPDGDKSCDLEKEEINDQQKNTTNVIANTAHTTKKIVKWRKPAKRVVSWRDGKEF